MDSGDLMGSSLPDVGFLPGSADELRSHLEGAAAKHRAEGDAAVAARRWGDAVKSFTAALKLAPEGCSDLLLARAAALLSFAAEIRSIPARTSEYRALYAHDPTVLASLALADATKAGQAQPTAAAPSEARGAALLQLERYEAAEAAFLEGLALEPGRPSLQERLAHVQGLLAEQEREQQALLAEVRGVGAGGGSSEAGEPGSADPATPAPAALAPRASLDESQAAKRQRRLTELASAAADDFECTLCLKLLHQPVTTPCGHTFCKACFARLLDHSNRCPNCRTVLHVGRELPVTITLASIIAKAFPAEAAARAAEAAAVAAGGAGGAEGGSGGPERLSLPLFVMSTLLPGEKMALNIFEPRYRLMIRRCMEGSRRMGMAQTGRTGPAGLDELAVEAEITDCQPLPDGRYYLEVVGRRRIRITSSSELDGYRVATAEVVRDVLLAQPQQQAAAPGAGGEAGPGEAAPGEDARAEAGAAEQAQPADVPGLAQAVLAAGDQLLERMRGALASRRVGAAQIREVFERLGDKPAAGDPEAVSWWGARLLLLVAPSNSEGWLRRELMAAASTEARLRMLQDRLAGRAGDGAGMPPGCAIM